MAFLDRMARRKAASSDLPQLDLKFQCIFDAIHFMNASIVDLRYRMKDVLLAIDRGETVTILYRGKKRATLVPFAASLMASAATLPKTGDQPLFGLWKDRSDVDPVSYLREVRRLRTLPLKTAKRANPRKQR